MALPRDVIPFNATMRSAVRGLDGSGPVALFETCNFLSTMVTFCFLSAAPGPRPLHWWVDAGAWRGEPAHCRGSGCVGISLA